MVEHRYAGGDYYRFLEELPYAGDKRYIYKVKDTIQNDGWFTNGDTLDYSMTYKSMYCGQNGNKTGDWWLASPSADVSGSGYVCRVGGYWARLGNGSYGSGDGVSPLVSLKSSFIPEVEE